MPSIASDTISARIPHEYTSCLEYEARQRGITKNALMNELIGAYCAKLGSKNAEDSGILDGAPTKLYGVALSLVDDLEEAGYPENEIMLAFKRIRDDKL